jgi:hypothetical protein
MELNSGSIRTNVTGIAHRAGAAASVHAGFVLFRYKEEAGCVLLIFALLESGDPRPLD